MRRFAHVKVMGLFVFVRMNVSVKNRLVPATTTGLVGFARSVPIKNSFGCCLMTAVPNLGCLGTAFVINYRDVVALSRRLHGDTILVCPGIAITITMFPPLLRSFTCPGIGCFHQRDTRLEIGNV